MISYDRDDRFFCLLMLYFKNTLFTLVLWFTFLCATSNLFVIIIGLYFSIKYTSSYYNDFEVIYCIQFVIWEFWSLIVLTQDGYVQFMEINWYWLGLFHNSGYVILMCNTQFKSTIDFKIIVLLWYAD